MGLEVDSVDNSEDNGRLSVVRARVVQGNTFTTQRWREGDQVVGRLRAGLEGVELPLARYALNVMIAEVDRQCGS